MPKSLPKPILISITILLFLVFAAWWLYLMFKGEIASTQGLLWTLAFQLIIFWGSILGFIISHIRGGFKNILGKAIFVLALGLMFQAIGNSIFTVYTIVFRIQIPYPSLADIAFFGCTPVYIYGVYLLGKASGFTLSFKSYKANLFGAVLPLALLFLTLYLFFKGYDARNFSLPRVLLDLAYPLGQAAYVSFAMLVYVHSKRTLGGVMRNKVMLILIALVMQYIADNNFLYQAINNTWVNGSYGDFIYFTGYFLMALALINLGDLFNKENKLVIKKTLIYALAVGALSWIIFAITFANQWFLLSTSWARSWMIPILVSGLSIFIFYIIWKQFELSDKTRYEFVTIATHKFRTPLTRIKHGIDLLLDEANQVTDKNVSSEEYIRNRELLERLKKDNLELIELTSLMLKSGKTNKVSSHELSEVDLAEVFFKVVNSNRHNFESKNIKISSEKLNAPTIKADPRRIKSLVEILIDNALHYTYENGEVGVSATCKEDENQIKCTVSNTGIPIPSGDKKKIFESFYRTEDAKKMNTEGTGLGLFLAKNIIEMHGGKIWVEDTKDGRGVKFIFTLPLS